MKIGTYSIILVFALILVAGCLPNPDAEKSDQVIEPVQEIEQAAPPEPPVDTEIDYGVEDVFGGEGIEAPPLPQ